MSTSNKQRARFFSPAINIMKIKKNIKNKPIRKMINLKGFISFDSFGKKCLIFGLFIMFDKNFFQAIKIIDYLHSFT